MSISSPQLVIIRGIPGGGKSYLAVALRASLGASALVILDPDTVDKTSDEYRQFSAKMLSEGVNEKFHPFRFLRAQAHAAILAGKTIIWNQAFTDFAGFKITVDKLVAFAAEHGITLPVLVAEVEISRETARARINERTHRGGHAVSDERLDRFFAEYQSFAGKGYPTISVNGEADISVSVASVVKALAR
jgi:predicted ABC-type ATPase